MLSKVPSLLISTTSKFECALINFVSLDGWDPGICSCTMFLPLSPICDFLLSFISETSNPFLKKFLPLSKLISAAEGKWYLGHKGSTTLFVVN